MNADWDYAALHPSRLCPRSMNGIKLISFLKTKKKITISTLILMYLLTYILVRSELLLIHRVSFKTNSDSSRSYYHKITQGDFGIPMLTGRAIWIISDICLLVYFPLGLCESLFWYLIPRDYNV